MGSFTDVTAGNATMAADINQYADRLNGTVASAITLLGTSNTATPLGVSLPSAPSGEVSPIWAQVSGDAAPRINLYLRSDGYGGFKAGAGAGSTARLFAQAGGWQTDVALTVGAGLTVVGSTSLAGLNTSGAATIGGNLQANGTLTVNGASSFDGGIITTDGAGNLKVSGNKVWNAGNDGAGSGLDADLLDGHDTSFFLAASSYTAADVLTKIKTVDGSGSGLDADTLDGHDSSFFATAGNYLSLSPAGATQIVDGPVVLTQDNRFFANIYGSVPTANGGTHNFVGFTDNNANKLAQFGAIPGHGSGDMAIAGSTYWTTTGSAGFNNSATFSGFDVAEVYATDRAYPNGTVLCPGDDDLMHLCTHDGCHAALIVSKEPGFGIGGGAFAKWGDDEEEDGETPQDECKELLAICGRVRVFSSGAIAARALVTADGHGGIRAMRAGEQGFALGYALHAAKSGTVGIVMRPMYCQATAAQRAHA